MRNTKSKWAFVLLAALCFLGPLMNCFFGLKACGGMHSPYYFVGYDTGFGGRKLLGTIFSLVLPEYVHHRHLIPYILAALVLMAILFTTFIYKCLLEKNRTTSTIVLALFLTVYLVSPFSFLRMMSHLAWYADIWLYLSTLIFLLLYLSHRKSWWYWPSVVVIVVASTLTHHIFCCLFFPMFVALFVYDTLDGTKVSRKKGIGYSLVCMAIVLTFIAVWFFGDNSMDIDTIYDNVSSRTNCVCTKERLYFHWLYGSNAENIQAMWDIGQFPWRYYQFLPVTILLSPLIAMFCAPWIMVIRATKNRIEKIKYLTMFLLPTILIIPMFIVATDYSRWYYAWFFCQMMLLLMLHTLNDNNLDKQLHRIFFFIKKHWAVLLLFVIYICSFHIGACGIDWVERIPSLF